MSKYIDVEPFENALMAVQKRSDVISIAEVLNTLMKYPVADVAEVVRCKDCKYGDTGTDEIGRWFYKCIGIHYGSVSPTDYCSYGEKEEW